MKWGEIRKEFQSVVIDQIAILTRDFCELVQLPKLPCELWRSNMQGGIFLG